MKNFFKAAAAAVALCALASFFGCAKLPQGAKVTGVESDSAREWTITYSDGKVDKKGKIEVKDGEMPIDVSGGYYVIDGKKTKVKVPDGKKVAPAKFDEYAAVQAETKAGTRYAVTGGKAVAESNTSYNAKKLAVRAGERYVITLAVQAKNYFGIIFADSNDAVVYKNMVKSQNLNTYYDSIEVTVPANATTLYVSSRNPVEAKIEKVATKTYYTLTDISKELTLACFNCGQFHYADEKNPLTASEYFANWKKMITDVNADIFSFEDVINTNIENESITENITDKKGAVVSDNVNSVLNINSGATMYNLSGAASCLRFSSKIKPETMNIIPLTYSGIVNGSEKITQRYYAVRAVYELCGKQVAFYSVHLCADGHMGSDTAVAKTVRKAQYEGIIEDARRFDGAVILGDFNPSQTDEYEVFKTSGFSMVNDGTIFTLRGNIPADNIIVKGLNLKSHTLIDSYVLNTDHFGFKAVVTVR